MTCELVGLEVCKVSDGAWVVFVTTSSTHYQMENKFYRTKALAMAAFRRYRRNWKSHSPTMPVGEICSALKMEKT